MKILAIAFICLFQLVSVAVGVEENVPSFTNEDIEKYRNPADNSNHISMQQRYERKRDSRQGGESKQQEYWCRKATSIKRKIEADHKTIEEVQSDISNADMQGHSHKKKMLLIRLKKAQKMLSLDEKNLNDLENSAHRKGIPPGWLRCQFE